MSAPPMLAQQICFDDVDVHARSLVGWQQTYDQLSAGHARTTLKHLTAERFQIFHETLDKRVVQRGAAPRSRLCLGLPSCSEAPGVFQGKRVGGESVTVLHGGQEFSVQSAEGMDLLGITMDVERLEAFAGREVTEAQLRQLSHSTRLNVAPHFVSGLRRQLETLMDAALAGDTQAEAPLEALALEAMLVLLDTALERGSERGANFAVSAYLVRRSQQLALDCLDEPLSVMDICQRLNVSRSTLQRSFQSVTGLRPVEYLRAVRLNAARRRLRRTCAGQFTVAEVASDLGFSHLGHFSGAYKALFGEHPSRTPRSMQRGARQAGLPPQAQWHLPS
ncbi:helix-turn-helix domain-containing protein [Pseudomonas sp. KNUC1026]|uniref:helix-turn-helix domain-containing protein n=1 Tax=Pseudomonas sp. KNUC1026 TaxID=2893890 RepID=UPI001F16CF92|nr:helix-turn-helix domain-containing protein [Pseudomonas sp. KNUC1026]UFH51027.1 helix-turn-helix domain-containing protein [Pseudomonas sp. KNUC1026]